jgi:ADP-ribosyl-[dinitrogen reductase] hydrolase
MTSENAATRLADRIRGCIIGGAIGDAMGGPFEGKTGPLRFEPHHDSRISDDSQLTLATCESIIEIATVSPEHIADRFLQWHRARRITSVGSSTLNALRALDAGLHWALAGAKGEMSAGNGAATRIAPVAFHLDPHIEKDRRTIRDVCRITHHNEEAYVGALVVAIAVRSITFDQAAPDDLFEIVLKHLPDSRVRDRLLQFRRLPNDLSVANVASEFGSSAYVVESVPLALYAARSIDRLPFALVLQNAIEAGGDTDTIAAISGQIAGAWIGRSKISAETSQQLPNSDQIDRIANEFAESVSEAARV